MDDYCDFYTLISNETAARLLPIVKIGAGLGVYLLAAGDAFELSHQIGKGAPVTSALCRLPQSVLIGGCINDHGAMQASKAKLSYSQKEEPFADHTGVFCDDKDFIPFKLMRDKEAP